MRSITEHYPSEPELELARLPLGAAASSRIDTNDHSLLQNLSRPSYVTAQLLYKLLRVQISHHYGPMNGLVVLVNVELGVLSEAKGP